MTSATCQDERDSLIHTSQNDSNNIGKSFILEREYKHKKENWGSEAIEGNHGILKGALRRLQGSRSQQKYLQSIRQVLSAEWKEQSLDNKHFHHARQ